MSIFVTTTKTGTARASAKPRCSLVMPTIPALAPICGEGGEINVTCTCNACMYTHLS